MRLHDSVIEFNRMPLYCLPIVWIPRGYFFRLRSILMLPGFKIPFKSEKITKKRISKKVDFQKSMKNGSEPISIYSFSCRIRIRIQNWTKTDPKAGFAQFSKNYVFYKNPNFYRAAAAAARPFLRPFLKAIG